MYEILVEVLGAPPVGLEFLYYIFAFVLLLFGLGVVFAILNAFFKIFRHGR